MSAAELCSEEDPHGENPNIIPEFWLPLARARNALETKMTVKRKVTLQPHVWCFPRADSIPHSTRFQFMVFGAFKSLLHGNVAALL